MKQVDEMPTEGQFVAVWSDGDNICSVALRYIDNNLFEYNVEYEIYVLCGLEFNDTAKFFIAN